MANQLKDKITLVTMNNQNSSYQYFNLDRFRNRLANISLKYKSKSVEASAAISGTQILESTGYPTLNFYELIAGGTYTFPKIKTNLHFMYRYNKNQPIYFVQTKPLF